MKNEKEVKQEWQTPEIVDLDIELTSKTTSTNEAFWPAGAS